MPKKAKSGKKGKLAKMTEEERILYLEQKLLAEEEMRRKKEEMLTQYLKDRLSKEEKNTKFNMAKLQNQWRVIMRESKCSSCASVHRCSDSHSENFEGFLKNHRWVLYCRSSRSQMFFKIGVLKNFAIFRRKHLCWSLFLIKMQTWRLATLLRRDSNTGVCL